MKFFFKKNGVVSVTIKISFNWELNATCIIKPSLSVDFEPPFTLTLTSTDFEILPLVKLFV